ncbi:MAG TPA: LysR family transcriptional regulator [Pseudomonas sp.]|nr:LysR family transcriptional regulator [Pseudomonas sp.]
MIRYRELQAFQAVVQAGSLAGAARLLELSPATVMRSIATLEARLHNSLFSRSPRGVELSPTGEQFALNCQHILQQTEGAERSASGLHAHPAGRLTLSLPLLMDHQVFTPIAVAYLEAFPDIQLVSRTSEGLPKLIEDGIDIALVVGNLPSSSGFAIPVGAVRPVVCGSPAYLAQWGHPGSPDELKMHRTVVATSSGFEGEWRFRCGRSQRLIRPSPVLTCTTRRAAIRAATLGLGLTHCMSYEAHQELHSGLLEPTLADFASPATPVYLLYREGRQATARVRSFIDFAVPQLRAHPAFHD